MKRLLLAAAAVAVLFVTTVKAGDSEKRIPLVDDSNKLYVSVYVENDSQISDLFKAHPQLHSYTAGNHYRVYRTGDPLMKFRAKGVETPSAYVQKANGEVVYATRPFCPRPEPKPEPEPEPDDGEETPPPAVEPLVEPSPVNDVNPWILLATVIAGLLGGAGSKLVRELRGEK